LNLIAKNPCSPYLKRPLRSLDKAVKDLAARHQDAPAVKDARRCGLSYAEFDRDRGPAPAAPDRPKRRPLPTAKK
jgi:hypothetical protein